MWLEIWPIVRSVYWSEFVSHRFRQTRQSNFFLKNWTIDLNISKISFSTYDGSVAEWLNALVLKTSDG